MLHSAKAWLGTVFSWQAKILTWRCWAVYSNMQTFHPLRGFSNTCLWCTSLAIPANSQLSLREGGSGKALQDITFSWAFMFRDKVPHQVGDLSCCGPSAHLLFLPLQHLHASPIFWPTSSPLPCLQSALRKNFPYLPVFPLLLSPRATVNLVPLAEALFDSENSSPQLGWALLEGQRRKPGGWKGETNLQQEQFTPCSKIQEIIFPHLDHWNRSEIIPLRVAIGIHLKLLGEGRVEVGEHWCAPAPSYDPLVPEQSSAEPESAECEVCYLYPNTAVLQALG